MARYFLRLAYKGTNYHGWQRQPNGITVQEVIEHGIRKIGYSHEGIVGCGRTDAGVHARDFYAHVDLPELEDEDVFLFKLNSVLPKDIAIKSVVKVHETAHARFDASARSYTYYIHTNKDPFIKDFSYYLWSSLDLLEMNKACQKLIGKKEFTSFARLHGDNKTDICDLRKATWTQVGNQIQFEIEADRFLRNMVRAIVGTMLEVGKGKMDIDGFANVIDLKDRGAAGASAPALGLALSRVEYPYIVNNVS